MKRNSTVFFIVSILITSIFLHKAEAQNVSPYWSLAGNSNASAAPKLGTTNNNSLRFYTNNVQRMIINSATGYVGIGNSSPVNILTVQSSGNTPSASWLNGLKSPVFMGFSEGVSSEFVLANATNTVGSRAVFQGRKSRGTLASPSAVADNDYITSLLASAYDGSTFQNPALVSFFVDGVPTAGHVPARISFITGTNIADRTERLKIGSTGNFDFNNGQLYLQQSTGFLGINNSSPHYKLDVVNDKDDAPAIYGNNTGEFGIGIQGRNDGGMGVYGEAVLGRGVYGVASANPPDEGGWFCNGVEGKGYYGILGWGHYGVAGASDEYAGVYGSGYQYGVLGRNYYANGYAVFAQADEAGATGVFARGGQVGLHAETTNSGSGGYAVYAKTNRPASYGIYAYSDKSVGVYGVTNNSNSYAGYFAGRVYSTGGYTSSDRKLKQDITDVSNAMDIINKLKPRQYTFREDKIYKYMNLPKGKHYGLIAQEVEEVLPNLVAEAEFDASALPGHKNAKLSPQAPALPHHLANSNQYNPKALPGNTLKGSNGTAVSDADLNTNKAGTKENASEIIPFKTMNYTELIPVIIKAMQEQQAQIKLLTETNKALQSEMEYLKSSISKNQHNYPLTSVNGYLKQSVPNPSTGNTVISYYVPSNAGLAQIKIIDIRGSTIKTFTAGKGEGQINIKNSALPAGTYNYSLVINNNIVDTKQMVLVR